MQPDPRPRMGNPFAQCRDAGKPVANSQRLPVRCLQPSNGGDDREAEAHQQDQESERAPDDQTKPSHSESACRAVRHTTNYHAMLEFTAADVVVHWRESNVSRRSNGLSE
jgi:hypothetical protein